MCILSLCGFIFILWNKNNIIMKHTYSILLSVCFYLLSHASFAFGKVGISVSSKTLKISLLGAKKGQQITLKDKKEKILFTEVLSEDGNYYKKLDLKKLPNGDYYIETTQGEEVMITPLSVQGKKVSLLNMIGSTYLVPSISLNESLVKVIISNRKQSQVHIAIYDDSGQLLKQTNPNNDYVVYTLYDASELESKSLQIKITEDDYTFTREVQL